VIAFAFPFVVFVPIFVFFVLRFSKPDRLIESFFW